MNEIGQVWVSGTKSLNNTQPVPFWRLKPPEDKDKFEWKEKAYRKYLEHICETNGTKIIEEISYNHKMTYFIGRGNNSYLVKQALKRRFWWTNGSRDDEWDEFNFIWTQWRRKPIIKSLKQHKDCTSQTNIASVNMKNSNSKTNKESTIWLTDCTPNDSSSDVDKKGSSVSIERKLTPSVSSGLKNRSKSSQSKIYDQTLYNHMECNYHLSNKKALYYNMKAFCEWKGEDVFDYLPQTFHIKEGLRDSEFIRFEKYYNQLQKQIDSEESEVTIDNTWIVKPGENTNRGSGIQFWKELHQIKDIVSKWVYLPNGKNRTYIIQKYLDNPFLYNKRKFDIRWYLLITTTNGNLQAYWCKEGYMRTASKEFSTKNYSRYVHLTNDAVQKHWDDYSKYENGNKLSYPNFQRYLTKAHPDLKCNFAKDVVPKLKMIALKGVQSVFKRIDPMKRQYTFELFGLDFILDENLRPYLLEMNTNPWLELSSTYLSYLIPLIIESLVQVAVDPWIPPPSTWPKSKKHQIPEPTEIFELIFNERTDSNEFKSLPGPQSAVCDIIAEEDVEEDRVSEFDDSDGSDDSND